MGVRTYAVGEFCLRQSGTSIYYMLFFALVERKRQHRLDKQAPLIPYNPSPITWVLRPMNIAVGGVHYCAATAKQQADRMPKRAGKHWAIAAGRLCWCDAIRALGGGAGFGRHNITWRL